MMEIEKNLNNRENTSDTGNNTKRRITEVNSAEKVEEILKKARITDEEFKTVLSNSTPKQRLQFIQRQLCHYLSESNLSTDQFYHEKFREDSARFGIENILDAKYILSAKRMLEVKATIEDLKQALSLYPTPDISLEDIDGTTCIKMSNPLPQYVGRRNLPKKKKFGETVDTFHAAGPLVIVSNIPLDVGEWQIVKDAIQETSKAKVRYISPVSDCGTCYAWLSRSLGDLDVLEGILPVVNQKTLKITLIKDESQYREAISSMKPNVLNSRTKDLQRIHSAAMSSPLEIDGLVIRNFGCVRSLLNDVLNDTEAGKKIQLESQAGKLLRYILNYHPHAFEKKGGSDRALSYFEVSANPFKNGKNKKCFLVVTRDPKSGKESKEVSQYWKFHRNRSRIQDLNHLRPSLSDLSRSNVFLSEIKLE